MSDPKDRGLPKGHAANWSAGFLPGIYQGTWLKPKGDPISHLNRLPDLSAERQRAQLDFLKSINNSFSDQYPDEADLNARIRSYELAYNMQQHAPEAVDLSKETEKTKQLYGMENKKTEEFGKKCLLARRLVERGVRFVQVYSGGAHNDDNWDAHGDLEVNHNYHAGRTDKPIAGLIEDLKERGLLDETLIIWGGEFGRQPTAEYAKGSGRDHNSYGFTMWMAGGGIKGGVSLGETDEIGSAAIEPLHVKRLHATILQQMGLHPDNLTYFHGGLDHKLVGVEGAEPLHDLIA